MTYAARHSAQDRNPRAVQPVKSGRGANSMTTARTVAPNLGGRANTRGRAVAAIFNADRLTAASCGLKHETDSGYQIGAQESAALAGGRRHFQRSGIRDQTGVLETLPRASNTDAACFKGMGSFRLASQTGEPYTTRPAAPFPAAPHSRVGLRAAKCGASFFGAI